jgi:hypothetical protein
MNRIRIDVVLAGAALAGMAYCHIADVGMKFEEHVYYMGVLFLANIALSLLLIPALVVSSARGRSRRVWAVIGGLAVATIAGFVWSRTVGFPQMEDHIGEWDRLGLASLAFEGLLVVLSVHALVGARTRHLATAGTTAAILALVVIAGSASAHGMHMIMRGDPRPYPDVDKATAKQRATVESLVSRTQAQAPRFANAGHARRLGFHRSRREDVTIGFPALRHFRKPHSMSSGRGLLDPRHPQALVYWCTAPGACTLAAFMYRSARKRPPTFGPLLAWHKHDPMQPWMTHIWLTGDLRSALARCAPWPHLEHALGIAREHYRSDSPVDLPCPEGGHGGM